MFCPFPKRTTGTTSVALFNKGFIEHSFAIETEQDFFGN